MVKGISWNRGSDRERRLTLSIIVYLGNTSKTLSLSILLALQVRIVSFSSLCILLIVALLTIYMCVWVGGCVCVHMYVGMYTFKYCYEYYNLTFKCDQMSLPFRAHFSNVTS